MADNGNTNISYDVSVTVNVTTSKVNDLLNYIRNYPSQYHLNSYNCTDFAIGVFASVGYNLPKTNGSWGVGSGRNPGDLGQDIRGLQGSQYTKNLQKGITPPNVGRCGNN